MKNFTKLKCIHWIAIIALTAVIGFSFVACGNGSTDDEKGKPTPPATYKLIAIASDSDSNRQILNFNMTEKDSRSARALNFTGEYTYELLLGGITISEGTVSVSNGVYTFTPTGGGSPFSLNANTDQFTGTITVSNAAKQAIIDAAEGLTPILPDPFTLEITTIMEGQSAGSYWNGTWKRANEDNDVEALDFQQQIVFSGNRYTLTVGDSAETGTFIYTSTVLHGDPDSVFIFSRDVEYGSKIAVYFWEGDNEPTELGDVNVKGFLSFYNWYIDPMEITITRATGEETNYPMYFLKQ